jgi:CRISPR-associated protein Cmr5
MSRSSLEQGRAAFAYAQVRDYVEGKGDSQRSEYRAYLKKLPTLVQTNGLAETMAFYHSKSGTYAEIYQQIGAWVEKQHSERLEGKSFLEALLNMDSAEYRVIAVEVLALANWMRRFADALTK